MMPPPSKEQLTQLEFINTLEKAFQACKHPFAQRCNWCNVCGAHRICDSQWFFPHLRDIFAKIIMKGG